MKIKKMIIILTSVLVVAMVLLFIVQFLGLLQGSRPTNLGINNNSLLQCPLKDNCVSSYSKQAQYKIEALPYFSSVSESIQKIRSTLLSISGVTLITEDSNYLYVECQSRLLGFVDDLEIYCDDNKQQCMVRSASRLGRTDFGVNRKRVEKIRQLLQQ